MRIFEIVAAHARCGAREKRVPARNHSARRHHRIGMNTPVTNPYVQNSSQVQATTPLYPDTPLMELEIRTTSRPLFEQERLGGRHHKGAWNKKLPGRPIGDRLRRVGVKNRRSVSEKSSSSADVGHDDEDDFPYRVAARSALDSMLEDDSEEKREEIREALAKLHEPLQQYTILFGAMKEVDARTDLSDDQKESLKNTCNEIMTDLVNRERTGIRAGLREDAESSPVTAKLNSALASRGVTTKLRDLRFKIGARAKDGVDEELTAMVIAKALLKNAGGPYAEEAMDSICARLMPALRTFSPTMEAAYLLTLSDAMAFSIVRSGFKVARELKRELVDKAKVLCKLHHVEAAVVLFMMAEQGWGRGKGLQLVNQLVDLKNTTQLTKAKVYTIVRNAADMLPIATWPYEKLSSRSELLEDLDRQVLNAYYAIPPLTTKAERVEEEWRNLYAAGRSPTPPRRSSGPKSARGSAENH